MTKLAVDSTQTLRALTPPESQDTSLARWFVVQLVTSDRPINLDTMPHLEVFDSYRLYTVVGRQDDGNRYALRLGFFSDDLSANTLCGYLKTFFPLPSIVRVSAAEHARFQNPACSSTVAASGRPSKSPAAATPAVLTPSSERKAAPAAKAAQKLLTRTKSLAEQLLDEAREVQISRSGRHRLPKQPSGSWISRLLGSKS